MNLNLQNMENDLIPEKNYWTKNWKWIVPVLFSLILIFGIVSIIPSGNATDLALAYSDQSLYENAVAKANKNQRVLEVIGAVESVDKLAILEGNVIYSNNKNSVQSSIRIKGTKGKGKMDIVADKKGTEWIYKTITVRIKNPKEEIRILNDSIVFN